MGHARPPSVLGQTIRTLREAKGLSRQALAKRLRLDRTAIAKWENGQHFPREGHQVALAS